MQIVLGLTMINVKIKVCLLLSVFITMQASSVELIKQIPESDRVVLTRFFKGLLEQGAFAKTLFGQKPAACFEYPHYFLLYACENEYRTQCCLERVGWKTWAKYLPLFKFKNHRFLFPEEDFFCVIFIHENKVRNVLEKNFDFFHSFTTKNPLKHNFDEIVMQVLQPNFSLQNFHTAQGLMFGYKKSECLTFERRCQVEETLEYFPYDVPESFLSSEPKLENLIQGYPDDLIQERNRYEKEYSIKRDWPETNPFYSTRSPGCMAFEREYDPNFSKIQDQIITLYNSDNFLEDFIRILTE